ncbi:hypothetical protein [Neokomagataea anthophila]|nr:hypothetical protein [Neokomagataea anthophila]
MTKSDASQAVSARARHKSRIIGLVGGVGLFVVIIYVITLIRF